MLTIHDRKDPRNQDERIFLYNGRSDGTAFHHGCAELGIKDLHFHDLRHEGTSHLFEAGFAIEQVSLVAGHKDWKMLRRHTHLKPELRHPIVVTKAAWGPEVRSVVRYLADQLKQ